MWCAQTMVRHKSRLEREKEAAAARRKSCLEGSARQARLRRSPAGSSFAGQVGNVMITASLHALRWLQLPDPSVLQTQDVQDYV